MMRINHLRNIADYWNREADGYCADHPEHLDASLQPSWGLWNIRERDLGILIHDLCPGSRLVDLGCGRGQDAVGYAELGAHVLAIDVAKQQLSRAIPHPRVEYALSSAEAVPVADESVDFVVSDHGAFDHSPPDMLLSEAARILAPGGVLAICTYSPLAFVCYDSTVGRIGPVLQRDYPAAAVRFNGTITAVEYGYADWIRCFADAGFVVERLEELRCAPDAPGYFDQLVDSAWGSQWPCDILWRVRKAGRKP